MRRGRAVFFVSLLEPHSNHIFVETRNENKKLSQQLLRFSKKEIRRITYQALVFERNESLFLNLIF